MFTSPIGELLDVQCRILLMVLQYSPYVVTEHMKTLQAAVMIMQVMLLYQHELQHNHCLHMQAMTTPELAS